MWRQALRSMRLTLLAFAVVTGIAICGAMLVRFTLLKNAFNTGTSMSRSYAAEAGDELAVYETLLTFGASSMDWQVGRGVEREELVEWLQLYFQRVETVLRMAFSGRPYDEKMTRGLLFKPREDSGKEPHGTEN